MNARVLGDSLPEGGGGIFSKNPPWDRWSFFCAVEEEEEEEERRYSEGSTWWG